MTEEPPSAAPHPSGGGLLQGTHILVVEDEALIGFELESMLEDEGATITLSQTLQSALAEMSRTHFSAAILDIQVGRSSALPIARVLQQRDIPFIFYSGQTAADPLLREWPDVPSISKPARSQEIVNALAVLLAA